MAIKVNYENINADYMFSNVYAFIDTTGDFFLVDEECKSVVLLAHEGCAVYNIENYNSINDFLYGEFGDCKVAKVYTSGNQYEIIVNG